MNEIVVSRSEKSTRHRWATTSMTMLLAPAIVAGIMQLATASPASAATDVIALGNYPGTSLLRSGNSCILQVDLPTTGPKSRQAASALMSRFAATNGGASGVNGSNVSWSSDNFDCTTGSGARSSAEIAGETTVTPDAASDVSPGLRTLYAAVTGVVVAGVIAIGLGIALESAALALGVSAGAAAVGAYALSGCVSGAIGQAIEQTLTKRRPSNVAIKVGVSCVTGAAFGGGGKWVTGAISRSGGINKVVGDLADRAKNLILRRTPLSVPNGANVSASFAESGRSMDIFYSTRSTFEGAASL